MTPADHWGTVKARWGVGRMDYCVDPGLYAVGSPGPDSPAVVTANYKMSFDCLRSAMHGRDAWILVLDTKGINVWCAAGKGTFGTAELVERIAAAGLALLVSHRRVILPQLGAPGVAAHEVRRSSGFRVVYGPIEAAHLPRFMDSGFKADPSMRRKSFPLWERTVLIPIELVDAARIAAKIFVVMLLLAGFLGSHGFWAGVMDHGLPAGLALVLAMIAGCVATPMLLPWLPGKAFSVKGLVPAAVASVVVVAMRLVWWESAPSVPEVAAWCLIIMSLTTYLAVNFTGASTYTSLSGVKLELRYALPLQIAAATVGTLMWVAALMYA